ncbi:MAG: GNAT family N-acetyltransferase [Candidatus Eremiobacteraeota bacterium]|nr:GNAT family N-acetyltransferase [Candidatus Eremiobacteraeota bacterium]
MRAGETTIEQYLMAHSKDWRNPLPRLPKQTLEVRDGESRPGRPTKLKVELCVGDQIAGMPPTIRLAHPDDAAAIGAVHHASRRTTYTALLGAQLAEAGSVARRIAQWQRALGDGSQSVFAAEENGCIVGFASCGPSAHRIEPFDAELYSLYLLAEAQSRGIGAALLHASAARLVERNFNAMLVWVLESNVRAVAFYRRFGGEYLKSAPNPVDDHPDAVYGYRDLRALKRATFALSSGVTEVVFPTRAVDAREA